MAQRGARLAVAAVVASAVVVTLSGPAAPARAAATFAVLQMNLCHSGKAPCYAAGRTVAEAVEQIHRYAPDLVTVQEICYDDLYGPEGLGPLAQAMADLFGAGHVSVDFVPAVNRDTRDFYRCVDGRHYGIGLIHHGALLDVRSGWYAAQDASEEVRAWTCVTLVRGRLTGCTTHLSTDPAVGLRQCRELMGILTSPWAMPEVLIAGDLNLVSAPGTAHDVGGCLPAGYDRRGDGTLQHVLFTRDVHWLGGAVQRLRWTDHPLLYERFRL